MNKRRIFWAALALIAIAALVIFVRLRLLSMPLERDEGEYAYMGQLMRQGIPPYQLAYNMKLPGTYATYALIMSVFGETASGIHFGFLIVNLAELTLMFFVARRLTSLLGAVVACACYGLLALCPGVMGLAGHATHLVTLWALVGMLLLLRTRNSGAAGPVFWSGICFGLSFVCKQPGLYFGMFGFLVILRDAMRSGPDARRRAVRQCSLFSAGMVLPFALTCLIIWKAGTFDRFWFWTFSYAKVHAGLLSARVGWKQLKIFFSLAGTVTWCLPLAGAGLICLLAKKDRLDRRFLLLSLLVFSLLGFGAGLYFTGHYFVVMLPIVSLLAAIVVETAVIDLDGAASAVVQRLPVTLFILGCVSFVFENRVLWFQMKPDAAVRNIYGNNPFPESRVIGNYIREHTAPDATIAVIGSEPQIYFYAHRHSATGYIYMYDLVQMHPYASQFQREMISDVEAAKPEYMVLVLVNSSWMNWPGADTTLRDWGAQYIRQHYDQAGVIYIYNDHTDYFWDKKSLPERNDTPYVIEVFQRKSQL